MPDTTPRATRTDTPEGPCALLQGRWSAADLGERTHWRALQPQLAALPASDTLGWNLRELQWLDHVGAQLLWNHWGRAWPARLEALPGQRAMLERAEQFSTTPPAPEPWSLGEQFDRLGALVVRALDHMYGLLLLVGQLVLDVLRLLRAPRRGPWRDVQ